MESILGIVIPLLSIFLASREKLKNLPKETLQIFFCCGLFFLFIWLTTVLTSFDIRGIYAEEMIFYVALLLLFISKQAKAFSLLVFIFGLFPINIIANLIIGFASGYSIIPFKNETYIAKIENHRIQSEFTTPGMSAKEEFFLVKEGWFFEKKVKNLSPNFYYDSFEVSIEKRALYFFHEDYESKKMNIDTVKIEL